MSVPVGVRVEFDPLLRYTRPTAEVACRPGDLLMVQTEYGEDAATVVCLFDREPVSARPENRFVRAATAEEAEQVRRNRRDAAVALRRARQHAYALRLPMNMVKAHYLADRSKLLFFFVAENRVDFRQLQRELAAEFRTRIELRWVPPREGTRIAGGIGVCGLRLCCNTFRVRFDNISFKCAREQGLASNIAKLTGLCNKPFCCLTYENAQYVELARLFPKPNTVVRVDTASLPPKMRVASDRTELRGVVRDVNIIKDTVTVRLETEGLIEVPREAVRW